jgi:hypothetical protein
MRNLVLATATLLSAVLMQSQALADASIAVAHPADDIGWALGIGYSAPSQAEADEVAMENCNAQRLESQIDAECRIVARFDNMCMALAKDTGNGGTAWAWGTDSTPDAAAARAMSTCQSYAGSRAGYCEVTMQHCDGD